MLSRRHLNPSSTKTHFLTVASRCVVTHLDGVEHPVEAVPGDGDLSELSVGDLGHLEELLRVARDVDFLDLDPLGRRKAAQVVVVVLLLGQVLQEKRG